METDLQGKFETKFLNFSTQIKKIGLSKNTVDDIFVWGQIYGKLLANNSSSLYRDDDFEMTLINKCLENHNFNYKEEAMLGELHLISMPLATGGHTRLMERLISFRSKSDVLVVRATKDIHLKLRTSNEVNIIHKEEGFNLSELVEIISKYKTIFLHIHSDDLLSAVAVGIVKKIMPIHVIFVNHADHIFSFGFASADVVAEVSYYGYRLSTEARRVNSSFLGIPINLTHLQEINWSVDFNDGRNIEIFSAGNRLKYKPSGDLSFQDLSSKILNAIPNANIIVVGPTLSTDWWWWKVKLKYSNRLRIISSMPYEQYLNYLNNAQVYLDSLPMTGGSAIPEIRSKNIPVFGLISGSAGYTPFDKTRFESTNSLLDALNDMIDNGSGRILDLNNDPSVIQSAQYVHSFDSVAARLDDMVAMHEHKLSPEKTADIDIDFYRKTWVAKEFVAISPKSCVQLVRYWKSGGRDIIFTLIKEFGFKELILLFFEGVQKSVSAIF